MKNSGRYNDLRVLAPQGFKLLADRTFVCELHVSLKSSRRANRFNLDLKATPVLSSRNFVLSSWYCYLLEIYISKPVWLRTLNTTIMSLNMLAWNCQGLGKPATQSHLTKLVAEHVPDILFLQETKNKESFIKPLMLKFNFTDMVIVNPTGVVGTAGGMVLAWSNKISVSVVHSSDSQIDVVVTDFSNKNTWMLSAIYGCPYRVKKHLSWDYFKNLSFSVNLPWLVMGT